MSQTNNSQTFSNRCNVVAAMAAAAAAAAAAAVWGAACSPLPTLDLASPAEKQHQPCLQAKDGHGLIFCRLQPSGCSLSPPEAAWAKKRSPPAAQRWASSRTLPPQARRCGLQPTTKTCKKSKRTGTCLQPKYGQGFVLCLLQPHGCSLGPPTVHCDSKGKRSTAHLQPKDGHRLILCALQLPIVDGINDGAGVAQLEAAAHAVGAARPAWQKRRRKDGFCLSCTTIQQSRDAVR